MDKNNNRLVLLGAGGHAKVCHDIAISMKRWSEIIILDDNPNNNYFKISDSIDNAKKYIKNADFFVSIGNNKKREKILKSLEILDANIATLIHPHSSIAPDVEIDLGTVIMAGVVVNSATKIGKGCIINTASSVDHDNKINDFVHISPGVHLAGSVTIDKRTWVGMGANIINNITIGSDIIIGAGSLVIKDLYKQSTYYGMPIK